MFTGGEAIDTKTRTDATHTGAASMLERMRGKRLDEIDASVADASDDEIEMLVDEIANRLAARLSSVGFAIEPFAVRIVVVERRDLYERDVVRGVDGWHVQAVDDDSAKPNVVSRWQGLAPLVRCENHELPIQSAGIVGLLQVDGAPRDQDALTAALAQTSDDEMAQLYRLRGCSDREVARALDTIDLQAAVMEFTNIGAEVARHFGNAHGLGRRVVTQLEVIGPKRTYVTQTVADEDRTEVHGEAVTTPTIVIRFFDAVDFARICSGEATPIELVAAGKVQVEGDISVFAQVDMLRW